MFRKVDDILFCKKKIKEEVAKYPSDIVKHRRDIGNDFFETPNIKHLCDIFHKITNNEIQLKLVHEHIMMKKEKERNNMKRKVVDDEPNTQQTKKQKTINTVSFEFKFDQPAVFHAVTAMVKSSVGKSIYDLFPQQRN
jgi:hypothetical protein